MKTHYVKNKETDYTICGKEITEITRISTDINDVNCRECKLVDKLEHLLSSQCETQDVKSDTQCMDAEEWIEKKGSKFGFIDGVSIFSNCEVIKHKLIEMMNAFASQHKPQQPSEEKIWKFIGDKRNRSERIGFTENETNCYCDGLRMGIDWALSQTKK